MIGFGVFQKIVLFVGVLENFSPWLAALTVLCLSVKNWKSTTPRIENDRIVPEPEEIVPEPDEIFPVLNNPIVHRPARILVGEFGPIRVPDNRDGIACRAFIDEQMALATQAAIREQENRRRVMYHTANSFLVLEDPIGELMNFENNMEPQMFRFAEHHLNIYLYNPP